MSPKLFKTLRSWLSNRKTLWCCSLRDGHAIRLLAFRNDVKRIIRQGPLGDSYTSQAMTIANMRALGVTSLFVACECGRETVFDASDLPGAIEILAIRRMLKCRGSGERPVDVRPDWKEYSAPGNGRP